jgi:hypothetical protein
MYCSKGGKMEDRISKKLQSKEEKIKQREQEILELIRIEKSILENALKKDDVPEYTKNMLNKRLKELEKELMKVKFKSQIIGAIKESLGKEE